jgi:hypothetical protein
MSAPALMRSTVIQTERFSSSVMVTERTNGTALLEGVRIFKMGTFKDSLGIERTWEEPHLQQMEFHYKLLKEANILPNVPIRADHSISVLNVVGYFADVYRAADDPMFLAASVEFTEPEAYEKWKRGSWRSRSLEVGWYETNDGAQYWPVILGLAFVDLPAVEGLYENQVRNAGSKLQVFTLQDNAKENDSMFVFNGQNFTDQAECERAINYAAYEAACNYAAWEAAANYAAALEAHNENARSLGVEGVTVHTAQPANHGAPRSFAFRVNGQSTDDPVVAQRHIDTLESFRRETAKTNRESFVDSLVTDKKITAAQVDQYKAHVALDTMSDEGFASFTKLWENAPVHSMFGQHGTGNGDGAGQGGEGQGGNAQTLQEQIDVQQEIITQLHRSGMSDEKVKKTEAFQKLTALQSQQTA